MDFQNIKEMLTTQWILSHLGGTDPLVLLSDPFVSVPFAAVLLGLLLFRMLRTLVVVLGLAAMWIATVYLLPHGSGVTLGDIGSFSIVFLLVAGTWIYFFLVRGD